MLLKISVFHLSNLAVNSASSKCECSAWFALQRDRSRYMENLNPDADIC